MSEAKKPKNQEKKKNGRPSKKGTINLKTLCALYAEGKTDLQVAQILDISRRTLLYYKKDKKFLHAITKGKEEVDKEVEVSLFKRATGYEHEDVDIKVIRNQIVKTKIIKHYPPDATSMIFWLKNRKPEQWRDKQELEHSGTLKLEDLVAGD
jgi:hypothetical protein